MALLQNSNAVTPASGFELKSVRSNSGDSPRFTRDVSNGNKKTFTVSFWTKRCDLASGDQLWGAWQGTLNDANWQGLAWQGTNPNIAFQTWNAATVVRTNTVYRDPSAWYHIVLAIDSTQGTAADRLKLYVNGEQVTDLAQNTYPAQNFNFDAVAGGEHTILTNWQGSAYYGHYDGYMAEFNFIDGAQLTPSSFGETNEKTNQWQPKNPTDVKAGVTFGTTGYYLPFSNDALATSFPDSTRSWNQEQTYTVAAQKALSVDVLLVAGGWWRRRWFMAMVLAVVVVLVELSDATCVYSSYSSTTTMLVTVGTGGAGGVPFRCRRIWTDPMMVIKEVIHHLEHLSATGGGGGSAGYEYNQSPGANRQCWWFWLVVAVQMVCQMLHLLLVMSRWLFNNSVEGYSGSSSNVTE